MNGHRTNTQARLPQTTLPNNEPLLLPQRLPNKPQRPLSMASSNESLNDSLGRIQSFLFIVFFYLRNSLLASLSTVSNDVNRPVIESLTTSLPTSDQFRTSDDIRSRLNDEIPIDSSRIDAVLNLTQGLPLTKQYELSKTFLQQIQHELSSSNLHHQTFVNGSFINEFD